MDYLVWFFVWLAGTCIVFLASGNKNENVISNTSLFFYAGLWPLGVGLIAFLALVVPIFIVVAIPFAIVDELYYLVKGKRLFLVED